MTEDRTKLRLAEWACEAEEQPEDFSSRRGGLDRNLAF